VIRNVDILLPGRFDAFVECFPVSLFINIDLISVVEFKLLI